MQVKKEIEIFRMDTRAGRLLMVALSPRVNHPASGTLVITIFDQAVSLVTERCPGIVCIVSSGAGKFLILREANEDILQRLEPLVRVTGRVLSDDNVLRLHVKKVQIHCSVIHSLCMNTKQVHITQMDH